MLSSQVKFLLGLSLECVKEHLNTSTVLNSSGCFPTCHGPLEIGECNCLCTILVFPLNTMLLHVFMIYSVPILDCFSMELYVRKVRISLPVEIIFSQFVHASVIPSFATPHQVLNFHVRTYYQLSAW